MDDKFSRRKFVQSGLYVACAMSGVALVSDTFAQTPQTNRIPDRGPRLNLETVKEFVIAGHGDIDKVKILLTQEPKIINASWDWGGGDWETALGGAAHTGHKAIALFLLEQGARIDLFAAAMLGKLEIVKTAIEAFPATVNIRGPHGISLLNHAKAGGAESVAVLKYLESLKPSTA